MYNHLWYNSSMVHVMESHIQVVFRHYTTKTSIIIVSRLAFVSRMSR